MVNKKRKVLIIMGRYLPGYKDGGPVRSIKNLVDYLGNEYEFKILTCDRDHGDEESYKNIKVNDWNDVENAQVYYVPPKGFKITLIEKLSKEVDCVYCCGCFNDYAINTLIAKRLKLIRVPVIVAAMGLFSPNEFRIKYRKKKSFVTIFNILGMFKNIYWSATSEMEIREISEQIKIKKNYFIAEDLPRRVNSNSIEKEKKVGELKIAWLSRIAPKKNLKGAIKILQNIKGKVEFNIYGPKHTLEYWEECEELLRNIPQNVKWEWKGIVESEEVVNTFKKNHIFLFPTLGENYGHVIQEALSAGCPVILSDQTPWNEIEKIGVGSISDLNNEKKFIDAVDRYMKMNQQEFNEISNKAMRYISKNSKDKIRKSGYREIFNLSN